MRARSFVSSLLATFAVLALAPAVASAVTRS